VQRWAFVLLHLAVRRCFSLRAVSAPYGEYPAAEVSRYLESLAGDERGAVDPGARSADLLFVLACRELFALPWAGLHGRKYAGAVDGRLREVVLSNRGANCEHAEARVIEAAGICAASADPAGSGFCLRESRFRAAALPRRLKPI
jgi:hypothetical protein